MCFFLFILSLVSSPLLTRTAENSCKSNQWQCRDGACVSLDKVCDTVYDCSDNSDEALPFCNQKTPGSSMSCILPPYPAYGTYEVEDLKDVHPGQSLASFALTVRCRKGFGVVGDGSGIKKVYCVNGKWHQDMPKCVRFCKLNPDPSVRYMCYYPGTGIEVCKQYVPPGMSVEPVCNRPIYYSNELLPNMRCLSGVWNYIALCKAECGRVTPGGTPLATGGIPAKRGELPWHVGIYRKTTKPYTQICGGSLVSNNIVISAAHCFWKDLTKLLPAADFGVAGGNIYRSWDLQEEVGAQRSDVKEIKIPSLFEGEAANFQEDIAVLTLTTPFNFTTFIRPVCLDFGANFDRLQLQHGKLGKVAGWGLTAANGQASEILKVVEMPFINVEICISTLPATFREYITGDKFCAGYTNGTALCQGDSGGGLAFSERERGVDRYYLRGIVSAAPNNEDKLCNDNVYTTFTKITKHQEFLKEAFAASARKSCPLYSFQCDDGSCVDPGADCNGRRDCPDGSDESEELCQVTPTKATMLYKPFANQPTYQEQEKQISIYQLTQTPTFSYQPDRTTGMPKPINTQTPKQDSFESRSRCNDTGAGYTIGDFPWPVAIYKISKNDPDYICGGTLISNEHVITTAHSLPIPVKPIIVKLGLYNAKKVSDTSHITRTVVSATVHPDYNASYRGNDIAILRLNEKVEFKAYVRAACLWSGNSEITRVVKDRGNLVGWRGDIGSAERVEIYVANPDDCRINNGTVEKAFCVSNSSRALSSGAGFYLSNKGSWRLRGVYSTELKCPDREPSCASSLLFIDIAQYMPWINSILSEKLHDSLVDQPSYQKQERTTTIYQPIKNPTFNSSSRQVRTTETPKPISTQALEQDSFESKSRCKDTGFGYTIGDFPWPVAIYKKNKNDPDYICGGTLISNEHIITTAHSLPTPVKAIIVKIGLYNAKKVSDTSHITRTVVSATVHPDYNASYRGNDIAILRLNEKVEFKAYVRAACLWSGNSEITRVVKDRGNLVGWRGDIGSAERVEIYVANPDDCRINNGTVEKAFCASNSRRALSSGAGFYLSNKGSWRLRGVYSTELKCPDGELSCTSFLLFIDIAQYMPWINNILSENE